MIPKHHTDGNLIVEIGASAFISKQLTSVAFPNSITTIGSNAFKTNSLTSLVIPNTLTNLGSEVFASNTLNSVTFLGAKPTVSGSANFIYNPSLPEYNSIRVNSIYLNDYRSLGGVGASHTGYYGILEGDANLENGLGYQ